MRTRHHHVHPVRVDIIVAALLIALEEHHGSTRMQNDKKHRKYDWCVIPGSSEAVDFILAILLAVFFALCTIAVITFSNDLPEADEPEQNNEEAREAGSSIQPSFVALTSAYRPRPDVHMQPQNSARRTFENESMKNDRLSSVIKSNHRATV